MLETLLVGGGTGILVAILASLIVLTIYRRRQHNTTIQLQGWEHEQEARQQQWQIQHEKRTNGLEKKLSARIQHLQQEWHSWEQKDMVRADTLVREYEAAVVHTGIELEVARLPHIEDASLPEMEQHRQKRYVPHLPPARLQGSDISGRDLSRRYLAMADLRGAKLVQTNFFMADLSGACLAGADLSDAELAGANLTNADLRDAVLTNANLLVADLNNAVLIGTNLLYARNLTMDQIDTAIYDSSTQFDTEIDVTLPRIPHIPRFAKPRILPSPMDTTDEAHEFYEREPTAVPPLSEEASSVQASSTSLFPETLPDTPYPDQETTLSDAPALQPPAQNSSQSGTEEQRLTSSSTESPHTENPDVGKTTHEYNDRREARAS